MHQAAQRPAPPHVPVPLFTQRKVHFYFIYPFIFFTRQTLLLFDSCSAPRRRRAAVSVREVGGWGGGFTRRRRRAAKTRSGQWRRNNRRFCIFERVVVFQSQQESCLSKGFIPVLHIGTPGGAIMSCWTCVNPSGDETASQYWKFFSRRVGGVMSFRQQQGETVAGNGLKYKIVSPVRRRFHVCVCVCV